MRILFVTNSYPFEGQRFWGIFNAKLVEALKKKVQCIIVISPRPYIPFVFQRSKKGITYARIKSFEIKKGINIYRPKYLRIPKIGAVFWTDFVAYLFSRNFVQELHKKYKFDIILSNNVYRAGGLAWRLGKCLNIPACGWANGNDVRAKSNTPMGRAVKRALLKFDVVFYQSSELLGCAAILIQRTKDQLPPKRHIVISRGIPIINHKTNLVTRKKIRVQWGVEDQDIVILYLGRIDREKGLFELCKAIYLANLLNRKIKGILVGANPGFDDSSELQGYIDKKGIHKHIKILSPCEPDNIWENFDGADIFAFTSYKEGMPNSLLEAMSAGLPSIAFNIPAIVELDKGTNSLLKIKPFDVELFSKAIFNLANSTKKRKIYGKRAQDHVNKYFNIDNNVKLVIETLKNVIS
jgi:teichuronic acid biosynthesis glycosyltransferase TuaC